MAMITYPPNYTGPVGFVPGGNDIPGGTPDGGTPDGGTPDGGRDGGTPDGGTPDGGLPGTPDGGLPGVPGPTFTYPPNYYYVPQGATGATIINPCCDPTILYMAIAGLLGIIGGYGITRLARRRE